MGRLFISFSGGRTSAYMTHRLLQEWDGEERPLVLFANTGQEHEQTLRFVDACDRNFGFNTVWLESVTHPQKGIGNTHKIVTFGTASRYGEPFEGVIKKHGIPNRNFPHCTRELKLRPMHSYLREIGWKPRTFDTAIGIRADEIDRVNSKYKELRLTYPLIGWGIRKSDILAFWKRQSFDLDLPEHLGNCVWCWKKSLRKSLTLAKEHPNVFEFPLRMEREYPMAGPGDRDRPRRFFRGNIGAIDILDKAKHQVFEPFVDGNHNYDIDLDKAGSCSESCEVHAEEDSYFIEISQPDHAGNVNENTLD